MPDPDLFAAIFVPTSLAAIIYTVAHYFYKWRALEKMTPAADVEKRLARLEVAIDDMTAEIGRMTESHRFLTAALSQRGLPAEVPHG
jgi:hypothetical protein